MKKAVAIVLTMFCVSAFAAKTLEGIPLKWQPRATLSEFGALSLTDFQGRKIQIDMLTDARKDPALIGENREKEPVKRVTTSDNVPKFIHENMKKALTKVGLDIVDNGAQVIIGGEIKEFMVVETNNYESDVTVKWTVKDAAGTLLWTGVSSGDSKNFGRSYNPANYYECLSDSILQATHAMLQNADFRKAVAGK
jgi:Uncharacterized lipoprotein